MKEEDCVSIAFYELYPIVVASILWGEMWKKQRIIFLCDNSATVAILNKGRSKSPHIMPLMRRLTLIAAKNNFIFSSIHVPGRTNLIADALSRLQISKFRNLAPQAQDQPCSVPHPKEVFWSSTTQWTCYGPMQWHQAQDAHIKLPFMYMWNFCCCRISLQLCVFLKFMLPKIIWYHL